MSGATLWRFNRTTGFWVPERQVTDETADGWLDHFTRSYPGEVFRVAKRKPRDVPQVRR